MGRSKKKRVTWQIQTDENGYHTFSPWGRYGSRYHIPDHAAYNNVNGFCSSLFTLAFCCVRIASCPFHGLGNLFGCGILVALLVYATVIRHITRGWHVAQARQPLLRSFYQTATEIKGWHLYGVQLLALTVLVAIFHFGNINFPSSALGRFDNYLFVGYAFVALAVSTALILVRNFHPLKLSERLC